MFSFGPFSVGMDSHYNLVLVRLEKDFVGKANVLPVIIGIVQRYLMMKNLCACIYGYCTSIDTNRRVHSARGRFWSDFCPLELLEIKI